VGLFDRPANSDYLKALVAKPAIPGLSEGLVGLSDGQWRHHVQRLRDVSLLAPRDKSDPEALDAHPLVREWFGQRARVTNEAAWRAAHSRLYDHLRRSTREGSTPTLGDLAPLYHAIAHGCLAERHQEALSEVYKKRICRWRPDGQIAFYTSKKLGAVSSDLAAIGWFFDPPYQIPTAALTPSDRAWVLAEASFGLRSQGRLQEALPAMDAALRMAEEAQDYANAARRASTLSETELLLGDVFAATATAAKSVVYADRAGEVSLTRMFRATQADALHAAGDWEQAKGVFADAEQRQREWRPQEPLLYSTQGYLYCDLLLSQREAAAARDRAVQTIEIARVNDWILDVAHDNLTLGRAHLSLALQCNVIGVSTENGRDNARTTAARLDEAVEGLRGAGQAQEIPRGLLARAAFRRAIGDWNGAKSDLDEAKEIAEPGLMRLYWCDCALEGARLVLARLEAFAPLNGLVERSPPPPVLPDPVAEAALGEEARKELDVARKLIAECGYHRRDEELAELDAVMAGGRRFADLPPRV
jgi:tetratricopeptide (TPR) repeat protein